MQEKKEKGQVSIDSIIHPQKHDDYDKTHYTFSFALDFLTLAVNVLRTAIMSAPPLKPQSDGTLMPPASDDSFAADPAVTKGTCEQVQIISGTQTDSQSRRGLAGPFGYTST